MKKTKGSREYGMWSKRRLFFLMVFSIFTSCFLLLAPVPTLAQTDYRLLAPLPLQETNCVGNETGDNACKTTAMPYLRGIFILIIAIAGGLAVIMIIFGGIKYMSTDAFGGKSEAKDTIRNALWGLLLAISAWLILYTINPKLIEFDLRIPRITTSTGGPPPPPPIVSRENCANCPVVSIQHKPAPYGCAAPGPCIINGDLNNKLVALNSLSTLLVTESFPPTRAHADPCHNNGTCVDATSAVDTKTFINNASSVGLRAVLEVQSEARAQAIREATGLSSSQVKYVAGITGEHYSLYLN